ncbi:DUF393 domain-containing protein [Halomonas aquamarina]|uniref:DUF393 domain-containing protein n=1 Tax=Vreelandella aquamarina TaxID=77097 RepID=A0ACC5VYH2_9GAMM|nr:DUF393 domain-containing protein [Halomonas aquamarina]MBZ5488908.1 DUF393 domain-containing protein [Halomonas aquamarina]
MSTHACIKVYYDAVCPSCRRDRRRYARWAGERASDIQWCDVSEHHDELRARGVAPDEALKSLHLALPDGRLVQGIDAYRVLMARVALLRPIAWLIGLPLVKPALRALYDGWVKRRLKQQGRWS